MIGMSLPPSLGYYAPCTAPQISGNPEPMSEARSAGTRLSMHSNLATRAFIEEQ